MKFNKGFNVNNVVKRLVRSVLALYVGGTIMTTFGTVMTCTYSPFYSGLSLIGWTVDATYLVNDSASTTCTTADGLTDLTTYNNLISDTTGAGVLAVVGIIAIAQIVTEFISW